jgi:putative DNA primase/helicase
VLLIDNPENQYMPVINLNDAKPQNYYEEQSNINSKIKSKTISEAGKRLLNDRSADIGRALLGWENKLHSTAGELRWGTNGSVSLIIAGSKSGDYFNHERKTGGGPLQMVCNEGGMLPAAAIDWVEHELGIDLEREEPRPSLDSRIVTSYDYMDESGALLFQVCRLRDPKDFRQRRPDGNGGWEWKVKGTRAVLYHLDKLSLTPGDVLMVEGEKDVDRLWSLGFIATCNPGGVYKWRDEFADMLAGRRVVIIPDNDKAGKEHAETVYRSLLRVAEVACVLELPELPEKGDVSDWLDAGHTADELRNIVYEALEAARDAGASVKVEEPAGDLVDIEAPYTIAEQFLIRNYREQGVYTLVHHRDTFYAWSMIGAYHEIGNKKLISQIYSYLNRCSYIDGKDRQKKVKPDTILVNKVLHAIGALVHLDDNITAPCWLGNTLHGMKPADIVACTNGLLHLPTRKLWPATPRYFTHNAVSFAYDPDAPKPVEWLKFLGQQWGEGDDCDVESIVALQEIFGLSLTGDTSFQKAFLLIGPPRSGKGTIARVLTEVIGSQNMVSPVLSSFASEFGLMPLLEKRIAIISDARLSGRVDQVLITERILSITGEDSVTIHRKYKNAWIGRLQIRFLILSNELPGLVDSSGALANRFIILELTKSFLGNEDKDLINRLLKELSGIFNWSLDGWDSLNKRGKFVQPKSAMDMIEDFADLGSPVSAFVRDRCVLGPDKKASVEDIYKVWGWWCEEEGRKPGAKNIFCRNLKAAYPEIEATRYRVGKEIERGYSGIGIREIVKHRSGGIDLNDAPLQSEMENSNYKKYH